MGKVIILLVDDEAIALSGWKFSLESAGYYVKTALSGGNALEIIEEEKPDIVFTDLIMPNMNGVEVCKNIKAIYPDIEVVLMSGHPGELEKHLTDFLEVGGRNECLRKPMLKDEIIEIADKIVIEKNKYFL